MFGTSGVRGVVGDTVTADVALHVGAAAAAEADEVVVARDPRVTGAGLADAAAAGARQAGADVQRLGVASTPTAARYADETALVVTASHNPPEYNGFKLFNADGTSFDESQRQRVREHVDNPPVADPEEFGRSQQRTDAATCHADEVVEAVDGSTATVVVDAAGGAASELTPRVLSRMGCTVHTVNCRFDGEFESRPAEPVERNLDLLKDAVEAYDADVGVAHDGDGDRTAVVDGDGVYVKPDILLAAFARHEEADRVVAPVNTSAAVDDVADVTRVAVGDVNVAEELKRSGAGFGGEPSNTWIFPRETLCPDGVLAAARIAEMAEDGVRSYVDDLPSYVTLRDSVESHRGDEVVERVTSKLRERYTEVTDVDGVRVDTDDGWFLVRASGTEPLVRVTSEARNHEDAEDLLRTAREAVEEAVS